MAKWTALATIVLALTLLLTIPPRNRAASIGGSPAAPAGGTFTIFDAPGAGTAPLEGTGGLSINSVGDVAGGYIVTGNVTHGFVRTHDGKVNVFDAPGAGTSNKQGTFPTSINSAGIVTGIVSDANDVYHGFVGPATGPITVFDAPGAKLDLHAGTVPMSINADGAIAGMYRDANLAYHGFVRTSGGAITSFDAPGAGAGFVQGTFPININSAGEIVGYYRNANYVNHGFMRAASGKIITFDAPGAGSNPGQVKDPKFQGTDAISINLSGVIAGTYADANYVNHGFVRAADGSFTEFDAPGAATTFGTISGSINCWGGIAGAVRDANGVFHGFVRTSDGTITEFDAPGAGGMGFLDGTAGVSVNDSGAVTGVFADTQVVLHGFLFTLPAFTGVCGKAATTLTIVSSQNPTQVNQTITLTGNVASLGGGPVTGTVSFQDGAIVLGTANVGMPISVSFTTVGAHSITATYSGDANHSPSSAALQQVVDSSGTNATTTKLSYVLSPSLPNSALNQQQVLFRHSISLTATVSPAPPVGPGEQVIFILDNVTELGMGVLNASGVAKLGVAALKPGPHSIRAYYPGDATNAGSFDTLTLDQSPRSR